MRGHGSQWISNKINIRHPGQLKKSIEFCQLFSTVDVTLVYMDYITEQFSEKTFTQYMSKE